MSARPLRLASAVALLALVACGTRTIDPIGDDLDGGKVDATADAVGDAVGDAPSPSFTACDGQGASCTLTVPGCCDACGTPQLSAVVAVASSKLGAYRLSVCPDPGGAPCPDCPTQPNPNLQAVCRGGGCVAIDVSKDDLSACASNADCELRYASCCEACDGSPAGLIALAKTQVSAYAQAICNPAADCPGCAPRYPANKRAVCTAAKHCVVQ